MDLIASLFKIQHNLDLDDSFYDYRLSPISEIQKLDKKLFFFFGELNVHRQEWFKSVNIIYGIVIFDFSNLSGCTQIIGVNT